jgi:hypothetical protein
MPKGVLNCSAEGRFYLRYVTSYTGEYVFNASMMDVFTTLIAAFDSTAAQSYGIVRRACNYGLTGTGASNISRFTQANIMTSPGTGLSRWDSVKGGIPGNNAWVLYEFTQASIPFWVLIQYSKESIDFNYQRFGESPGFPGGTQAILTAGSPSSGGATNGLVQYKDNSVNISIGIMPDGTSPWLGTMNNDGADTKSNPVWAASAVKFPRANDDGGWDFWNSSKMIPIIHESLAIYNPGYSTAYHIPNPSATTYDAFNMLYHVIFDQDNILIFFDVNGQGNVGSIFYFGKFKPYDSSNSLPYVCLFRENAYDDSYDCIKFAESREDAYIPYGCYHNNSIVALSTLSRFGFMSPYVGGRQPINGGVYHPGGRHVAGCILGIPPHMNDDNFQLLQLPNNQLQHDSRGNFKHIVAYPDVYVSEYPSRYGYLGRLTFFKTAKNVRHGHFFSDHEMIVGGPSSISNKLIIPWDSNTEYGMFGNRYGTVWG